ncbi:LysR substrate-binding domain-containing protein [Noviherbaspirillum saxi]|uniref:LysR family transcriptional regulator n=1 Tax=Noviherbaspirillum saxi TaxID=2320863 RepID=A0A3A3FQ55_9BURK|nr:LysR substrate-binding domain-containing protein [Noviherbaspirillum saxi]RJF98003.1 LysR family transcriptional regulator [Noviherbaspirillum saxi]
MKIRSPSMSELHAFVTVARVGSFTRAAEELCVTQAAVSRAINRLESHFGQVLLRRSAHLLTITPAGCAFLEAIRGPVAAIEEASATLMSGSDNKRLTLSVVPTLAGVWLLPRLPIFSQRHPGIEIIFAPYRRDEDFAGPQPDAAILTGAAGEWPARWDCDYVIGREMVPVAHPARLSRRRAAGQWTTPAELMNEQLLYHTSTPTRWQLWLREAGVLEATPKLASGFDHVSILIQAVKTDMGVAVLQRCLIQEELASGQLVIPFNLPISLPRGYFLCAPVQRRNHPALVVFRQWLLETAEADRTLLMQNTMTTA